MSRPEWERAGLSDPEGNLGRPIAGAAWIVPHQIDVVGEHLTYGPATSPFMRPLTRGEVVQSDRRLLDAFLNLSQPKATAGDVERFARSWGVLEICVDHDLPMTHVPPHVQDLGDAEDLVCKPDGGPPGSRWWREPLTAWWLLARRVRAVLDLAAHLSARSGAGSVDPEAAFGELDGLLPMSVLSLYRSPDTGRSRQRRLLAACVEALLRLGDVRIGYRWDGEQSQIDIGGGSLFGALALQTALAVGKRDGMAVCDECGSVYLPHRINRPGVPRRCPRPECRDRAAKRESARRRRARDRGETSDG